MHRLTRLVLAGLLVPGLALAQAPARLQLLPPLTDAPSSGEIDADYALLFDSAEKKLKDGRSSEAIDELVALLASKDPFFIAQREALSARAVPLLREAATKEAQAGHLEAAVFARDAAWIASGHSADPEHAQLLVALAERRRAEAPKEALWLVRRAARANPLDGRAADLDASWSQNSLRYVGWGMMTAGVASVVAGALFGALASSTGAELTGAVHPRAEVDSLIATQRTYGVLAAGAIAAGIGVFYGGIGVVMLGNPEGPPVSPRNLPALPESR